MKTKDFVTKLVIFDDALEVNDVLPYVSEPGALVVSFSLQGKYALTHKGIACCTPDELVDLPDFNAIGEENLLLVKKVCALIDARMVERIDYFKINRLTLASSAYFSIKIFFDAVYSTYAILKKLLHVSEAGRVIVLMTELPSEDLLRNSSHVASYLCKDVFSSDDPRIAIIPVSEKSRRRTKFFLQYIIKQGSSYLSSLRGSLRSRNGRKTALVLHDTHDIPYLRDGLLKGMNFFYLHDKKQLALSAPCEKIAKQVRQLFESLRNDIEYRRIFGNDELLFIFIHSHLESYFCDVLARLVPQGEAIKQQLQQVAPLFLLTSHCRLDLNDAFLLETARSCDIPVIAYQEGGGAGYLRWPFFNLDSILSNYFLVYGDGVKQSNFFSDKTNIIPVGSLRLARIKDSLRSNKSQPTTIYLVLDNVKVDSHQHYPFNGGFFSQSYAHQVQIIKLLANFNVNFVIKTIPNKKFLYELFLSRRVSMDTTPLTSLLGKAAAFILDAPTTALQECLITDRPVALLYDRLGYDFDPVGLELLQRRVRVCSEPRQFIEVIDKLLKDVQREDEMQENTDFVKRFCLLPNTNEHLQEFFTQKGYSN